ncbi:MAG TPA: SDR family NAD(P)-dependent oxidoreductase [Streptosporangiaceae bacterium]
MTRKQIVIPGGGTAGTKTANRLHRRSGPDKSQTHAAGRDDRHVYQPRLLFAPCQDEGTLATITTDDESGLRPPGKLTGRLMMRRVTADASRGLLAGLKHHVETGEETTSRDGLKRATVATAGQFKAFYGPWALVTGASAGIGAEFARQLAGKGLNLILVARRAELLTALAGELARAHGVEVRTVAVDLSDRGFPDAIREAAADVDVGLLVNNAGTTVGGKLLETDLEQQRRPQWSRRKPGSARKPTRYR